MSTTQHLKVISLPTGENFAGKSNIALKLSSGRVVSAVAAGDEVIGILAMDPGRATATDGSDTVPVALIGGGGVGLITASAAITADHILVAAAGGKAAGVNGLGSLAADSMGFGFALEAASAADEVIQCILQPVAAPHSA